MKVLVKKVKTKVEVNKSKKLKEKIKPIRYAIHCNSYFKARKFIKLAYDNGYCWIDDLGYDIYNFPYKTKYFKMGKKICYTINDGIILYCSLDYFKKNNFKIIEFDDSFRLSKNHCHNSLIKAIIDNM